MHKTASTYIQRRIRKNQALLIQNGILTPASREQDKQLLEAINKQRLEPWEYWLESAETKKCRLLVSHEAFSSLLHRTSPDSSTPRGCWFSDQLRNKGWNLKIIGFIRNQDSYLNSRYTQLVKRFNVQSDFPTYAEKVMQGKTFSECDLITLFGWLMNQTEIDSTMIPFGSARDQHGLTLLKRPDPFQQLLSALAVPEKAVRQCQQARSLNQQPGRMGVALALEVSNFLNRHHPESLKNHAKDLRRSLEQLAKAKEWNTEPFNGLERTIHDKIIARYQASNAKFCCHFWPETTWDELYPKDHRHAKPQSTTHSETTTAELAACRQKVIADTLSPEIVAKLPQ